MKKVFISVTGNESGNPIKRALEAVSKLVHEVVDNSEDADLIIVDSASEALGMLKENDEAIVLVAVMMGEKHNETGARSLRKAYPGRVYVGQIFRVEDGTDDVLLVPYIIAFAQEKEE
jgi:hypothetical protein